MSSNNNFSDRLLSLEQTTPAFRERYEREVKAMLERTLRPFERVIYGFSAALALALAAVFGYVGIFVTEELPILIRAVFGLGAVTGIAWAVICWKIIKAGKLNLKTQPAAMTGMMWGFVVVLQTIFLLVAGQHPDAVRSVFMVLYGLTFLVGGVAFLLGGLIEQSELRTKERLLGIEMRLADISEALAKSKES